MLVKTRRIRSPPVGRVGKTVDVQQVVALLGRQIAALFLQRTEAREIDAASIHVARQEGAQKLQRALRIGPQHRAKPLRIVHRAAVESRHFVRRRPVRDVLVMPAGRQLARAQYVAFFFRKCERSAREKQDVPALQRQIVVVARRCRGRLRVPRSHHKRRRLPLATIESPWRAFRCLSPASSISFSRKSESPWRRCWNGSAMRSNFPRRRPAAASRRSIADIRRRRAKWRVISWMFSATRSTSWFRPAPARR